MLLSVALATSVSGQQKESTRLTFDSPVRLPTVTLPAGTYTFERQKDFGIPVVTVFDSGGREVSRNTTRPINRSGNGKPIVLQSSAGSIPMIAAWYPSSGRVGYEFIFGQAAADTDLIAAQPQSAVGEQAKTPVQKP
jgi:hypothetical protein